MNYREKENSEQALANFVFLKKQISDIKKKKICRKEKLI